MKKTASKKIPYASEVDSNWTNIQGIADHFGVPIKTARRWAATGKIPVTRFSRKCHRFNIAECDKAAINLTVKAVGNP